MSDVYQEFWFDEAASIDWSAWAKLQSQKSKEDKMDIVLNKDLTIGDVLGKLNIADIREGKHLYNLSKYATEKGSPDVLLWMRDTNITRTADIFYAWLSENPEAQKWMAERGLARKKPKAEVYKRGDRFRVGRHEKYILTEIDNCCYTLISLYTGSSWARPVYITKEIGEKELALLTGDRNEKFVKIRA